MGPVAVETGGIRRRSRRILDFFGAVGLFFGPYTRGFTVLVLYLRDVSSLLEDGAVGALVCLFVFYALSMVSEPVPRFRLA